MHATSPQGQLGIRIGPKSGSLRLMPLLAAVALFAPWTSASAQAGGASGAPSCNKELEELWTNRATKHAAIGALVEKRPEYAGDFDCLWKMSRLVFFYGSYVKVGNDTDEEHLKLYTYGYKLGDAARKLKDDRVEGHYYFATNFGLYAVAKGITSALGSAKDLLAALDKSVTLDEKYHDAGPLRVRGRVYFKLPGVISYGDKKKALADLKRSVELAPKCRLNHAYLADVVAKVDGKAEALKIVRAADALPPTAGPDEEKLFSEGIKHRIEQWK